DLVLQGQQLAFERSHHAYGSSVLGERGAGGRQPEGSGEKKRGPRLHERPPWREERSGAGMGAPSLGQTAPPVHRARSAWTSCLLRLSHVGRTVCLHVAARPRRRGKGAWQCVDPTPHSSRRACSSFPF